MMTDPQRQRHDQHAREFRPGLYRLRDQARHTALFLVTELPHMDLATSSDVLLQAQHYTTKHGVTVFTTPTRDGVVLFCCTGNITTMARWVLHVELHTGATLLTPLAQPGHASWTDLVPWYRHNPKYSAWHPEDAPMQVMEKRPRYLRLPVEEQPYVRAL